MNVTNNGRRPPTVGYLAVLEDPQLGFAGGLLVISASGRPLEFHCSTPLAVTRAQEILFGTTLRSHLCGELIATTLLKTAKITPTVLLVQDPAAAPPAAGVPTMLLAPPTDDAQPAPRLIAGGDSDAAVAEIDALLDALVNHVELAEPFERVQEAVREAQRLSVQEAPASDAA
ncbi:hypothetical protein Pla123a_17130 [Posidoniimonas polymericola]|uniref:Uncharacterized protein n=1 Tax=Posidoniimonas polymericola TaxID=2528002 RepID=A0A5C5YSD2_9BACT|nr:hypothetical protein [Posidoniimonas polymericola]TWT77914.1 hypothetical protein Pla123a_17130 [Posidoniimonas polymericola]